MNNAQKLEHIFGSVREQVAPLDNFSNPQAEIDFLRSELARREALLAEHNKNQAEQSLPSVEIKQAEIATDLINQYHETPKTEIIDPKQHTSNEQTEAIALKLKPEEHDTQMESLMNNLLTKGVRNTLDIVRAMKNPHIDDDFYRFLVQYLAEFREIPGLKNTAELFKELDICLFEITLPHPEENTNKTFKEMIGIMEQFYAGMQGIGAGDNKDKNWYTLEIANREGSDEVVFYTCVPRIRADLFEQTITGVYPSAKTTLLTDDYNIFTNTGYSAGSTIHSSVSDLMTIKTYEKSEQDLDPFNSDPLEVLLSAFSKLKKTGEGASIQIAIRPAGTTLIQKYGKYLDRLRKGEKLKDLDPTWGAVLGKEAKDFGKALWSMVVGESEKKDDKEKDPNYNESTIIESVTKKLTSTIIESNIRLVVSAETQVRADALIHELETTFSQFTNAKGNGLKPVRIKQSGILEFLHQFSYREFSDSSILPLNFHELATVFHFPVMSKYTAGLKQSGASEQPVPLSMGTTGIFLGENNYRGKKTPIYFTPADRLRHFYSIGQTGVGKTQIFLKMILQDIANGDGCCFIDPHGSDVQTILAHIPPERIDDVVYFDPSYIDRPMGLNMMEFDERFPQQKSLVISELMALFDKLFDMKSQGGAMFGQYFRNSALLNMEDPASGNTVLEITRVLANKEFRDRKLSKNKNPIIAEFWKSAEATSGDQGLENFVPYISSKFDDFISNEFLRPVILQEKSAFNFREIMDSKKILLVNLSKGLLGEKNASLIGLIMIMKLQMAAMSRADSHDPAGFPPFYVYLDEFQNVVTESISAILSEARKYKLVMNMTHQFMDQLPDYIKSAVFGNVGNMAFFRIASDDAEKVEPRVKPRFSKDDIVKQENGNCIMSILVDGKPEPAFNVDTFCGKFVDKGDREQIEKIKQLSYLKYGRPRAEIEAEIVAKYRL